MALVLDKVQDYVDAARVLLEDTLAPYRYPDADIVRDLNLAVSEIVRLRPDLYFKKLRSVSTSFPPYSPSSMTALVDVDYRYRSPVLYYIVGNVQLRDQEDTSDARSSALLQKFVAQLMTATA